MMQKIAACTVLAACASAMRLAKPNKLEQLLTLLPEEYIVEKINNDPKSTWTAGVNENLASIDIEDKIRALGTEVYTEAPFTEPENKVHFTDDQIAALPKNFDAREKWPKCIHPIQNQAHCGSCWSFGGTEALSDRFCIAGQDVTLSPQWMVSCDWFDMGCSGGRLMSAWEYMHFKGVPSIECVPYSSGDGESGKCPTKCADGSEIKLYKAAKVYSVVSFFDMFDVSNRRMNNMMAEIYYNGPIEAAFMVYQDFYNYKGGVYQWKEGPLMGGHAIKIIGWGTDDKTGADYWLVANSWGPEFGENGYFRIARGTNECNIENNAWAGMPQVAQ